MVTLVAGLLFVVTADVHPAFVGVPAKLSQHYRAGVEWRKKKKTMRELLRTNGWQKDIGTVRSLRGHVWEAPSVTLLTPNAVAAISGFVDEMEYSDTKTGEAKIIDALAGARKTLEVFVDLYAWPGVGGLYNQFVERPARPEDVRDIQFVVLVNGNRNDVMKPIFKENMGQPVEISGSSRQSDFRTIGVHSADGGYSTVYYTTYRTEDYTAYHASYHVVFSLFDESGVPLVRPLSRTLSFRAFRVTHEHKAEFDLSKL